MRKKVLIAKVISRFPVGKVVVYNVGEYNKKDFDDLLKIARMIACENCVSVYILPRISSRKDPMYEKLFSGLEGTMYYGKCPDLKIVFKDGRRTFIEYESYSKWFSMRKVTKMLTRGAEQSCNIIIDVRNSNATNKGVRDRVINLINQESFDKTIDGVWIYLGDRIERVY